MKLYLVATIIFLMNIPFGYWRGSVKKYSVKWMMSIHLPIPVIILLRFQSGIGFKLISYPVLVGAFFLGQLTGSRLYKFLENKKRQK